MAEVTEVVKLRRRVMSELARMAFQGTLAQEAANILTTAVTEDGPRYRCCIYKERAVLKERIKMALNQDLQQHLSQAVAAAMAGKTVSGPVIQVMPVACDRCPIDKFMVTDACRNCVAHRCMNSCPRKAITVVQNKAYIDKTRCAECGMCKRSCPYGAIIEISRPCERACSLGAITADAKRRATINYDKCVQCGACMVACPFGAISDRSQIFQVIRALQDPQKYVIALLAPAFVGQFGLKVRPGQVMAGLRQMGFDDVREVSEGADVVTVEETKEFVATVPQQRPFMTTSCCPAFVSMVEKHAPAALANVSSTVSPMIAAGHIVKQERPECLTVFIGPCVAKKAEAQKAAYQGIIDYVLTFEELAAMFVGAGINLMDVSMTEHTPAASRDGSAFAHAGGLVQAVSDAAALLAGPGAVKAQRCDGLESCLTVVKQLLAGKTDANFLEGMACTGGCVGGPGAIMDGRVTAKLVDNYAAGARVISAAESATAKAATEKYHCFHRDKEEFSPSRRNI